MGAQVHLTHPFPTNCGAFFTWMPLLPADFGHSMRVNSGGNWGMADLATYGVKIGCVCDALCLGGHGYKYLTLCGPIRYDISTPKTTFRC